MIRAGKPALALILSGLLGACSTEPGGIFRLFDVDKENTSLSIGARQRTIIVRRPNVISRPGLVNPNSLVCAEPSPDVATAIATSFGSGVSVLGYGSGSVSAQTAEGVMQLAERTAAIQLMRDQMYRACEAYANGAITGTTYSLLMSRISETMVTLLLGETAGGAFGRSLGALGGKSSAEAKATMAGFPGAMADVGSAADQLAEAELKLQKAEADLAKVKQEKKDKPDDPTVTEARTARDRAKAERDALRALLQQKIETTSEAAGEIAKVEAAGGITAKPDAATAAVLADMQNNFVQRDPSQALVETCMIELGMWNTMEGLSELFAEPARKLVDTQGFNPHTLGGLVAAAAKAERTGLFDFCQTYLPSMASEIYRTNAAIRLEKIGLERRSQDLRWIEARAQAASAFASALGQCDRIGDVKSKESCKAAVLDVHGREAPTPSKETELLQQAVFRSVGEITFPTLSFKRAKAAFEAAKAGQEALTDVKPAELPSDLDAETLEKLKGQRKTLVEQRKKFLTDVIAEIAKVGPNLLGPGGSTNRTELEELERSQINLDNDQNLEPHPLKRRIKLAELDAARAKALRKAEQYDRVSADLNARINELRRLAAEISRFNDKLKQQ